MEAIKSSWINFLRQYGPIPRNDNMYDEHIRTKINGKKINPISFESEYLDELVANFKDTHPKTIILTGTAGDGKTYYCRNIWMQLGGTEEEWKKVNKVGSLSLGQKTLYVIKDLSELKDKDYHYIQDLVTSLIDSKHHNVFLVAANDGQLIDKWKEISPTQKVLEIRQTIETLLVTDSIESRNLNLRLYNLSRTNSAKLFPSILQSVLEHDGWNECNNCVYRDAIDITQRCPIWENKKRLKEASTAEVTKNRLIALLELCKLNGIHLPVRQLLILVSNMLLGHPAVKDKLLCCSDVPNILRDSLQSEASLYKNIFGENLSERKKENTFVFATLNKFGIGYETSDKIDNILIFGQDDHDLRLYYEKLIISDDYYGASSQYTSLQSSYLEGELSEPEKFLKMLNYQRQRLFFTIPNELVDELKLWKLTTFQYAGEFLEKVYYSLRDGEKIPSPILSRLVKGLNRVSTGMLAKDVDRLILATSGSHSQAKVSRVFEDAISVKRNRGEYVSIKLDDDNLRKVVLEVGLGSEITPVKLNLQLVRYEFISRVAEGALPGSFSRECYEDILAFKSRLLSKLGERRKVFGEDEEEGLSLTLLKIGSEGIVNSKRVEVWF